MDAELELAIALSLQEEKERNQQSARVTSWPGLHEVHCCGTSIFSLSPLESCPTCGRTAVVVPTTASSQHNSTIPSSSTDNGHPESQQSPPKLARHNANVGLSKGRSMAIKPTVGSFGRYNSTMLLHCGLSDSSGRVYNFDEHGCHVDSDWNECISIPIAAPHLSDSQWDAELDRHHKAELTFKSYRPYQKLQNNCYNYVIRFLNGIKFEDREDHQKEDIVTRFIQTPIDLFEGYFTVLKKLRSREGQRQGFVKLDPPQSGQRHSCDACEQLIGLDDTRYRCTECEEFDLCSGCKDKEVKEHKRSHRLLSVAERARYTCDGCRNPITGSHYRCLECEDFDLCGECHSTKQGVSGSHTERHRILKL